MRTKTEVALVILALATITAAAPATPTISGATTYMIALSGHAEVNDMRAAGLAGDMDAAGLVELTVDLGSKQICYDFTLSDVATPLMAHIHKGPKLRDGPSIVTLFTGPGADLDNCVLWTERWLAEIVSNPSNFYVNLYTTEYPEGAIRGQLPS